MPAVRFDHCISSTSAADIDDYLKDYAAQGFAPADRTVRHAPGLRNAGRRVVPLTIGATDALVAASTNFRYG